MQITLFHVNAFSEAAFGGNPAAVCLLDSWLDDELHRKVAAENSLSATAFLIPQNGGYEIRWFTRTHEIKLCGHATLASGYLLLHVLHPELERVGFQTRFSGVVSVAKKNDLLEMDFPVRAPSPTRSAPAELARALGLQDSPSEVLQCNDSLLAVFEDEDVIRRIRPDFDLLEQLHPHVVITTAPGKTVDFVSRYFAPSYGVPEDPVTGSAHCSLAPYWTQRLRKSQLHAQQLSERGGELWCEVAGDRVLLRGRARLTMEARLTL